MEIIICQKNWNQKLNCCKVFSILSMKMLTMQSCKVKLAISCWVMLKQVWTSFPRQQILHEGPVSPQWCWRTLLEWCDWLELPWETVPSFGLLRKELPFPSQQCPCYEHTQTYGIRWLELTCVTNTSLVATLCVPSMQLSGNFGLLLGFKLIIMKQTQHSTFCCWLCVPARIHLHMLYF